MTSHCAQEFKSLVRNINKKNGGCKQNPPNYADGKINITTRNGKTPKHVNGISPPPRG